VDLLARLYGQHLYSPHFSGKFMLNRVSSCNKYSALLIKVTYKNYFILAPKDKKMNAYIEKSAQ